MQGLTNNNSKVIAVRVSKELYEKLKDKKKGEFIRYCIEKELSKNENK